MPTLRAAFKENTEKGPCVFQHKLRGYPLWVSAVKAHILPSASHGPDVGLHLAGSDDKPQIPESPSQAPPWNGRSPQSRTAATWQLQVLHGDGSHQLPSVQRMTEQMGRILPSFSPNWCFLDHTQSVEQPEV